MAVNAHARQPLLSSPRVVKDINTGSLSVSSTVFKVQAKVNDTMDSL